MNNYNIIAQIVGAIAVALMVKSYLNTKKDKIGAYASIVGGIFEFCSSIIGAYRLTKIDKKSKIVGGN